MRRKPGLYIFGAALMAVASGATAQAAERRFSRLTDVDVKEKGKEIIVLLSGSRSPDFTTFTMKAPYRVIVDWAGSQIEGVEREQRFERGLIRRITSVQFNAESERISRVMIELAVRTTYRLEADGDKVFVRFRNVDIPPPRPVEIKKPVDDTKKQRAFMADLRKDDIPDGPLTEPIDVPPPPDFEARKKREALAARLAAEKAAKVAAAAAKAAAEAKALAEAADKKAREDALAAQAKAAEAKLLARAEQAKENARAAEAARKALARAEADKKALARAEAEARGLAAAAKRAREEEVRAKAAAVAQARTARRLASNAKPAQPPIAAAPRPIEPAETKRVAAPVLAPAPAARPKPKSAAPPPVRLASSKAMKRPTRSGRLASNASAPSSAQRAAQGVAASPAQALLNKRRADPVLSADHDPGRRIMKYIGFRKKSDVSEVFVRCDGKARYRVSRVGEGRVVLELFDTRIKVRNNQRALDTSFFKTAVTRVRASPKGSSTRVVMDLRRDVPYEVKRVGTTIKINFANSAS